MTNDLRRTAQALAGAALLVTAASSRTYAQPAPAAVPPAAPVALEMSLDQCLNMAMEKNHSRPASKLAVAAAEARHRQVLSAYWPQVSLRGAYEVLDQPQNFVFPSSTYGIGPSALTVPLPPGLLPVPSLTIPVPAQRITVPDQDVKLSDERSVYASAEARWLLWDGGMRRGLREQARAGVDVARERARRTDLEVVDSVTRLYWGAVMARQVHQVGQDTLARMEATLNLTESLYKEGSGRVRKTDYLSNKVMVETLRAAVALLRQNEEEAGAALAYTIGLEWDQTVRPTAREIPFEPFAADARDLVGEAFEWSPDWKQVEAGLRAGDGAVREARAGYFPKLALAGDLHRWWNDYDAGFATPRNKQGWSVRLGVELPLFDGFRTRARIQEAAARRDELREQRVLLREGIGLQVRQAVLGLDAAGRRYQATLDAANAAVENRDLNTRAYQSELVETEDVIKAQLMEAFMSVQHLKVRFDNAEARSRLNLLVGTEVARRLGAE